jgi:quinol monooxygenase YgiN
MMTCGLFVELEAARGQETAVERFLDEAVPMVRTEPDTAAWFAVRFRRYHYGIFDVFPDDDARNRHLTGPVARALAEHSALFANPPVFHEVEILADKLPLIGKVDPDRKGLFLRVKPHRGRENELAELFTSTEAIVDREPGTTSWFALRFANGDLGFFDAFETNRGRRHHLLGKAPRELLKNFRLLGEFPHVSLVDVQAEAFTGESRA